MHLLEDSSDALAELLAEVQIRADARDPGVACEPRGHSRVGQIDDAGKSSRAVDLHPGVEDVHANVVAGEAVRPVHNGVDEPLEPRVLGHERHIAKAARPG